ncbi:MAG: cob(I)yrinic acid a,c-diamide adenosyltransferase [Gemmatimonadota bacterium]|nr:MAG: cob(I)yrinic acid a,c-diamide adenosyltransferase [Gemmatimonadota bacterium]
MRIYTKSGDSGQTSFFGGRRVSKDDARVAAYGDVDELNSSIGVAVATDPVELEHGLLTDVQRDLFTIGARLASPDPEKLTQALEKTTLHNVRIAELESAIDRIDDELPDLGSFILPGGTAKSALLHYSRSVCRRTERSVVALARHEVVPDLVLAYLNRLSDLLFMVARLANHRSNVSDTKW